MPISSIPIPQIKLGKRKERSQMCEVFTDDGRWKDKELPALNSCVDDESVGIAFLLDPENQYLAEDNNWHQLITEKSQIPLSLRKQNIYQGGHNDKAELAQLGNDLFKLTAEQKQAERFKNAQASEAWNKFLWIVSIVCGTMVLIAGMRYLWG